MNLSVVRHTQHLVQSASAVWLAAESRDVDSDRPPLQDASDQELIAAVNSGSEVAFELLYRRHRDWVVSLAFRMTGDADAALDVMQETFVYFAKKFPGFVLTAQLKTFLYPAVRNLSIATRRRQNRLQPENPFDPLLQDIPDESRPVQTGAALSSVLAGLPEQHREVLLLRFVEGLTLGEISQALKIPTGTVKSRVHNGLSKLRRDPKTRSFFEQ